MSKPSRHLSFDSSFDHFLLRKLDETCRLIEQENIEASKAHDNLDRAQAVALLSDLLELPPADAAKIVLQ